jgi:hypothetical protein
MNFANKLKTSQLFIMSSKAGNNMTQYYLLRGKVTTAVSLDDTSKAYLDDVGDAQQAQLSQWHLSNSIAATSRPQFLEALPSQQIKYLNPSNQNQFNNKTLAPQSKEPFRRFHLDLKDIGN